MALLARSQRSVRGVCVCMCTSVCLHSLYRGARATPVLRTLIFVQARREARDEERARHFTTNVYVFPTDDGSRVTRERTAIGRAQHAHRAVVDARTSMAASSTGVGARDVAPTGDELGSPAFAEHMDALYSDATPAERVAKMRRVDEHSCAREPPAVLSVFVVFLARVSFGAGGECSLLCTGCSEISFAVISLCNGKCRAVNDSCVSNENFVAPLVDLFFFDHSAGSVVAAAAAAAAAAVSVIVIVDDVVDARGNFLLKGKDCRNFARFGGARRRKKKKSRARRFCVALRARSRRFSIITFERQKLRVRLRV